MAIAKRIANVNSTINVTPMVDVMLVLLIIFMVITPMLQRQHPVQRAVTDNPTPMDDADHEDAIVVSVEHDGKVYLGNELVTPDQIEGRIRDRLASKVDKRVYINADARAKYGAVVEVVDNVRAAGVDLVGLLTQQRRQGAAAARPPGQ
ncbi:MAG TPA: biopolymer transporter ExbD [Terriglobales bacterium]|jgi:biopolymer transport protein ExbD/biopolymer transport protein TolR|nr:biopolymer transporter ExbD [Terriglobales bacterium]